MDTPPQTVSAVNVKQQAAADLGLDVDRIGTIRLQMDVLRRQGVLVTLQISGTSMFSTSASWAEVGVPVGDIRTSRMHTGRKYLIPEADIKRIVSVEASMRSTLEKMSYDVTGFRPYRWIPFTAYAAWARRWAALLERFNQEKRRILDDYDLYVEMLANDFREIAYAAWKAISSQGVNYAVVDGRQYGDCHDFAAAVVAHVLAKMPSRERIERELQADYQVSVLYGQAEIAADEAAAEAVRAQAEADRQAIYLQNAILQEQLDQASRLNRIALTERELQIEAMRQAEAEHARRRLAEMASPFEEVFAGLRQEMAEAAVEMLDSIRKNGFVRGKVAERARGLLEMFDLMAVQDDHELRARLVQLRFAIGEVGGERPAGSPERSTEEVTAALEEVRGLVHQAKKDLLAGPSRFSFVE